LTERQYTVRAAERTDLDALEALLLALQDHLEAANPGLWVMKDEARSSLRGQIAARLAAPNSCVLLAEHMAEGAVGTILGRLVTNNRYIPSRAGVVDQLFVQEHHRRAGVGSLLMAELCRFFARAGADDLSLRYVDGNEEAAGFWSSLGFSPRIVTVGAKRRTVEGRLDQAKLP
jgi:GNAT superfamily N-acetyltransferase